MAARGALLPFALNFGGEAEGVEGVLVVCLCGQGGLLLYTNLQWSSHVLFVDSNFEILI